MKHDQLGNHYLTRFSSFGFLTPQACISGFAMSAVIVQCSIPLRCCCSNIVSKLKHSYSWSYNADTEFTVLFFVMTDFPNVSFPLNSWEHLAGQIVYSLDLDWTYEQDSQEVPFGVRFLMLKSQIVLASIWANMLCPSVFNVVWLIYEQNEIHA